MQAGEVSYAGGFIEHYVMPVLYPVGFTRARQLALGVVVAVVNGLMYWRLVRARVSVWRAGGEERGLPPARLYAPTRLALTWCRPLPRAGGLTVRDVDHRRW
jgi:hypothetical protein